MPSASVQPITNAARRPNASRANTYLPPALGWRVASSAKTSAPKSPTSPSVARSERRSAAPPPVLATLLAAFGPLLERQPDGGFECRLVLLVHELLDNRALRVDEEEGREDAHRAVGLLDRRRQ